MSVDEELYALLLNSGNIRNIKQEHMLIDDWFRSRWNRSLPFAEEINDRWERAKRLGFEKNTSVYDSSIIMGDVKVGENVWIGPYTILDGTGGLEIGSHCCISIGVQIYSHDSVLRTISAGLYPIEKASVKIGERCYIGPNTIISKGVQIGAGSIVGAMSFVKTSFPERVLIAGIPAQIKGRVKIEKDRLFIERLEDEQ